jgi:hypothetical protein
MTKVFYIIYKYNQGNKSYTKQQMSGTYPSLEHAENVIYGEYGRRPDADAHGRTLFADHQFAVIVSHRDL